MLPLEALGGDSVQISTASRDSPSRSLERDEEQHQVREALQRLQEHHRTILVLREFDGFDYQKIADLLDVKVGTVRSRLSRAREQMKRELTTYVTGSNVSTVANVASNDESVRSDRQADEESEGGRRIREIIDANT